MRARAELATDYIQRTDGRGRSRITTLRSESPLMLRPTFPKGPEPWTDGAANVARVCLAAGAAGPVGGDELVLRVDVGRDSTLVLRDVSATLLLPGPGGEQSSTRVTVHVCSGATLVWIPEPVIAAHGCRHRSDIRVDLDPGARLLLREELLLGRHRESPGTVYQHLRVRLDGRPLLNQQLSVGPGAPGWGSPAVTGGRRALGTLLVVDPRWSDDPPPAAALDGDSAVLPLNGPAALVSAVATDNLSLRRSLDVGLDRLTG
ncbi:urease accessory protein UreD [Geodermatophilus sp. DF01_2]|uniref:urease accessory protein UreD n=1 Tax=Geodermatophilus sp. DF01-2 TaxID=2559610 RepID=UPI00142F8678|nr:urease accessory protein UreD [Geodermatophilus sp. DF01_2]